MNPDDTTFRGVTPDEETSILAPRRGTPRTLVEIKDVASPAQPDAPLHKAGTVWVNGTEVCVEKDGIDIEFGENQTTVVTLRILPTEIRFNH